MMSEEKKWRCPYCDGLNDWLDETCQICGDGRRDEATGAGRTAAVDTYTPRVRPVESASEFFEPPLFEPGSLESGSSGAGTFKPEPLPPRPELPRTAYAPERAEMYEKHGHATAWFWLLTAAFVALSVFDGAVAWWTAARPVTRAVRVLWPLRNMSQYGLYCAAFLGLMPLVALWLRSKGAKALAVLLALAGCVCAGAALYAMAMLRWLYAVGWLMYGVAAFMALVYAANGKSARTFSNFCFVFGVASLVMTLVLTTYSDWMVNISSVGYDNMKPMINVGTMWWERQNWYEVLFYSRRCFANANCPAAAWLPFSRALVLLAMGAGFRMPQKEK